MGEEDSYELQLPTRPRIVGGLIAGTISVALLSGLLFLLVSTNEGLRNFFYATSVGFEDFALSLLLIFIWGVGGYVTGKVLSSGTKWGLLCGSAAGLLGQGIAGLFTLSTGLTVFFSPVHHGMYVMLGGLLTGIFATIATYHYEEMEFLRELEEIEKD